MRILHIITGLNNGGAEGVLYRLVTTDKGAAHHVISMMDSGLYGERLIAKGIPVHTLNMSRGQLMLKGLFRLHRLIRTINPNAVHTWMYHADLIGGIAAILAGKRAIIWGVRASSLDRKKTRRSTLLVRWLCARLSTVIPRKIVINSASGVRFHEKLGYDGKRIALIHNGYDPNQLQPCEDARAALRRSWSIAPSQVLIGMIGRYDPQKDHANLIVALSLLDSRKVPDWRCVLVGSGITETNSSLTAQLGQCNVVGRFLIMGPRSDISAVMNALDLHVLSSVSEAFPNVVAEAMACGTPCVTTDVGDAACIVGDTGWIAPHSDPAALAHAIQEALDEMKDSAKWYLRKDACRKRVIENYSLERMIASYTRVWDDAINDKKDE